MPPEKEIENQEPDLEQQQAEALAAIEAGIAEANGEDPPEPPAPKPDEQQPKPDDQAAGAGQEGAAGSGKKPDESAAAGKSKGGSPGGEPGKKAADAGKGGEPAKGKKAGEEPPDDSHITAPIPDDINVKTRTRIEKLVGTVKEQTSELEQLRTASKGAADLWEAIQSTGATPDQFGQTMDTLALELSEDPADRRKALEALQKRVTALAADLGETPPGADPLEGHADLAEDVERGDITQARAEELAKARNAQAAASKRTERKSADDAARAELEQAVAAARGELNQLDAAEAKKDPAAWKIIRPHLLKRMQRIVRTTPPAKWREAAEADLEDIRELVASGQLTASSGEPGKGGDGRERRGGPPSDEPMRPSAPAGGSRGSPSSMLDAIDAGIEAANHR